MWSALSDLIPAPILFGFLVLFGAAYLLAPEVGRRLADRTGAIYQCDRSDVFAGSHNGGADLERKLMRGALDLLARAGKGTGLEALGRGLADQIDETSAVARMSRSDQCRCLVEAAVSEFGTRTDIAVWLLSLRIVEGRGVTRLADAMATAARDAACSVRSRS